MYSYKTIWLVTYRGIYTNTPHAEIFANEDKAIDFVLEHTTPDLFDSVSMVETGLVFEDENESATYCNARNHTHSYV